MPFVLFDFNYYLNFYIVLIAAMNAAMYVGILLFALITSLKVATIVVKVFGRWI